MARILVVDDSKMIRTMIRNILKEAGHEIVGEGKNGLEAYDMYLALQPDIMTLDITMPLMDGIEALTKIKEVDPLAKIIIISSNMQFEKISTAISFNAEHLMKPVKKNELLSMVKAMQDKQPS